MRLDDSLSARRGSSKRPESFWKKGGGSEKEVVERR